MICFAAVKSEAIDDLKQHRESLNLISNPSSRIDKLKEIYSTFIELGAK